MKKNDGKQDIKIIDISEFAKINNETSLIKFCRENNKSSYDDQFSTHKRFIKMIKANFLSNGTLSLECWFEISIYIFKKFDQTNLDVYFEDENEEDENENEELEISNFRIYKFVPEYDDKTEKIKDISSIFDFIRKHKENNSNVDNMCNYIKFISYFFDKCDEKGSFSDFLSLELFDFTNSNHYDKADQGHALNDLIEILKKYLQKDKNDKSAIDTVKDIFGQLNSSVSFDKKLDLLKFCRNNNIDFKMDSDMVQKLIDDNINSLKIDQFILICSFCEDKTIPSETMSKMMLTLKKYLEPTKTKTKAETSYGNYFYSNKFNLRDLLKSDEDDEIILDSVIPINSKANQSAFDPLRQENIKKSRNKIFTPALINFIQQKINGDYKLGDKLNFNKKYYFAHTDNFNQHGINECFYLYCAEKYFRVPHTKDSVVEFFGHAKNGIPKEYYAEPQKIKENLKNNLWNDYDFGFEFGDVCQEFNAFTKNIFEDKKVLKSDDNEDIIKNQILLDDKIQNGDDNRKLTFGEIILIFLSDFKFDDYGITEENMIPNNNYDGNLKIDRIYFQWLLLFFKQQNKLTSDNFIFCVSKVRIADVTKLYDVFNFLEKYKIEISVGLADKLLDYYDGGKRDPNDYWGKQCYSYVEKLGDKNLMNKFKRVLYLYKTPLWLIIITLGSVFWGPWLLKKIFGCCYNFDDNDADNTENNNFNQKNQNPIPNQGNTFEESLNNEKNEPTIK